ncbi:MAG TPA: hypothetical protein PKK26_20030, partial [Candidatus Wallbacteria bacterium]|nr:hypothetical protein [Candidatus Wallbacteria bacterium]
PVNEIIEIINNNEKEKGKGKEKKIEEKKSDIDKNSEFFEIGNAVSNIVERANDITREANKRKIIEMNTVHEISKAMSARLNLDELLKLIIDLATKVLNAKYCSVMLLDEDTNELRVRVSNAMKEEVMKNVRI